MTKPSTCAGPLFVNVSMPRAPEEMVIQFLCGRRLERIHLATLRIDAAHHVLDGAVLASRVHALQHYEQCPPVAGVETFLQPGETLDVLRQHRVGVVLVEIEAAGVGRIERRKPEAFSIIDSVSLDQFRGLYGRNQLGWSAGVGKSAGTATLDHDEHSPIS